MLFDSNPDQEPTPQELAAIEAEWPLIDAEIALVDAEIRVLTALRITDLDWRRLRRAQQRVTREMTAYLTRTTLARDIRPAA